MTRLYVCPIVTTTTADGTEQHPLIADLGVSSWNACIATDPNTGASSLPWAMVACDVSPPQTWAQVDANAQCFQLTADNLDAALTTRVKNYLINNNVMPRAQVNGYATLRALCDGLVKLQYPYSSLAAFAPGV